MKLPSSSSTERYLQRATWGLWGQQRRNAQAELRGVIEDKQWRFKLLGLSDTAAEARALAELGRPGQVAAGLSRVHSLPLAVQGALLAGVLGALGVQMVGAAAGVRAVPFQNKIPVCVNDSFEGCGQTHTKLNYYLPVHDLFLSLSGVGLDPKKLNLVSGGTDTFGDKDYYSMFGFVNDLLKTPKLALHLRGERNPVITIGRTNVMVGTPDAPVMADSLVLPAVWTQLKSQLPDPLSTDLVAFLEIFQHRTNSQQQLAGLPDGRYALITTATLKETGCSCGVQLRLQTIKGDSLQLFNSPASIRLVNTPEALADAKATGIPAALVYRVGKVDDLRQIPLTPVKISSLKVIRK